MAFERQYVLVSIDWTNRCQMSEAISAAVASHDHERAAASIACMTNDRDQLHILIEKWRDSGDAEQDPAGSVDATATVGKPRRTRSSQKHDAGTTAGDLTPRLDYRLE